MSADADHKAPKCYSGSLLSLSPLRSTIEDSVFLPLEFVSVAQKYVKLSPAEAETVCAVHAMRYGLRYAESLRCLLDPTTFSEGQTTEDSWQIPDCCVLRQREDNSACIQLLERGWSKALAHVSTVYGVSSLWASQRIAEGRVELTHEGTRDICADPLTKLMQPLVLFRRGVLADRPELFVRPLC